MVKKVLVEIFYEGGNFSAHAPGLPGCVSTGDTPKHIKENIKEAIDWHVASSIEDNDLIDDVFKSDYELDFKFDAEGLLRYYKKIFNAPALSRLTGINEKQIHHYATGHRKPRPETAKKFEKALHQLGEELLAIEL